VYPSGQLVHDVDGTAPEYSPALQATQTEALAAAA
jgi:hypothetical protein